jgi:hypothetical protein
MTASVFFSRMLDAAAGSTSHMLQREVEVELSSEPGVAQCMTVHQQRVCSALVQLGDDSLSVVPQDAAATEHIHILSWYFTN